MPDNHHCEIDHLVTQTEMDNVLTKLNDLDISLKSLATTNHTHELLLGFGSLRSLIEDNQREQKAALDSAEERLTIWLKARPRGSLFLNILGFVGALAVLLVAFIGTVALVTGKPINLKDFAKAETVSRPTPTLPSFTEETDSLVALSPKPQLPEMSLQEQVQQLRRNLDEAINAHEVRLKALEGGTIAAPVSHTPGAPFGSR
jgi:hypothetical protein